MYRDSERELKKKGNTKLLNTLKDDILNSKALIKDARRTERINEKN